jgi:hypothetical protein
MIEQILTLVEDRDAAELGPLLFARNPKWALELARQIEIAQMDEQFELQFSGTFATREDPEYY